MSVMIIGSPTAKISAAEANQTRRQLPVTCISKMTATGKMVDPVGWPVMSFKAHRAYARYAGHDLGWANVGAHG